MILCLTLRNHGGNKPKRRAANPGRKRGKYDMKRRKIKTVWAYLDGKKLVDVVQAALDNNISVDNVKQLLIKENLDHKVTFKVE